MKSLINNLKGFKRSQIDSQNAEYSNKIFFVTYLTIVGYMLILLISLMLLT